MLQLCAEMTPSKRLAAGWPAEYTPFHSTQIQRARCHSHPTYFMDGERPSQGGHHGHGWSQKDEKNLSSPLSCLRLRLATDCVDSTNSELLERKRDMSTGQEKKKKRCQRSLIRFKSQTNSSPREAYSLRYWGGM